MKVDSITPLELICARNNSGKYENGFVNATRAIKNLKRFEGLQVGDVCNQKYNMSMNLMNGMVPERYMIIHKDEHNFLYIKRFLKSGGLSKTINCITISTNIKTTYEIDHSYANSVILEDDKAFTPDADIKRIKNLENKVKRINNKLKINFKGDIDKAVSYIETLNPGQKLWTSNGTELAIVDIKTEKRTKSEPSHMRYHNKTVDVPGKESKIVTFSNGDTVKDIHIEHYYTGKPVKLKDAQ